MRCFVTLPLLLAWALVLGCQASPRSASQPPPVRLLDVAPPPGIDPDTLRPRQGDSLVKASLTLADVVATIPQPEFLANPQPVPSRAEPPVAAQRAYLAGRAAYLRGREGVFEAIRQLQNALVLAPNEPELLSLLGRIYASSGNAVRAAVYLEQALRADPSDSQSLLLLGRHALSQRNWPLAIVLLNHNLSFDPRQTDPAMPAVTQFYLASALERQGHDAAAIDLFSEYLRGAARVDRSTMMVRELGLLVRQRAQTMTTMGDALCRLGRPLEAIQAYEKAREEEGVDATSLLPRLAYANLRIGRPEAARDAVLSAVEAPTTRNTAVSLLPYLAEHGVDRDELSATLRGLYEAQARPTALAIVIAQLTDAPRGAEFLRDHLAQRPGDEAVFQAMLDRQVVAPVTDAGVLAAVRTTVAAIEADPAHARAYIVALLRTVTEPSRLLTAMQSMPESDAQSPGALLLRGVVLMQSGQLEEAQEALSLASDAGLDHAKLTLARLWVAQERYDEAQRILDGLGDAQDAESIRLRVQVLAETDRSAQALELIDRALVQRPADVSLSLEKAGLLVRLGRAVEAERLLLDLLNAKPDEERVYESLFALYDPPGREASLVPDALRQWQRLMQRLLGTIPHSRLARLKRAEWAAASREHGVAEELLRGLLREDPRDVQAVAMLLQLLHETQRQAEGDALLDQTLERFPNDRRLLALAAAHYAQRDGDRVKAAMLQERLVLLDPPGPLRSLRLGLVSFELEDYERSAAHLTEALGSDDEQTLRLAMHQLRRCYVRLNRPEDLAAQMAQVIRRAPALSKDARLEQSIAFQNTGRWPEAERLMLELLAEFPDDPEVNNHLGYSWADRGQNLDQAQRMIEKALEAEPDNAAYLDSLGWVYYKLGRFDDAVTWLSRSRARPGGDHSVILNHLGDALYRAGKKEEAVGLWSAALSQFDPSDAKDDPEQRGLDERLSSKIAAVRSQTDPEVAPTAGE